MARLSPIAWQKLGKAVEHYGAAYSRTKGDHAIYTKPGLSRPLVIPMDPDVPVFIIQNLAKVLGVSAHDLHEVAQGRTPKPTVPALGTKDTIAKPDSESSSSRDGS